MSSMFNKIQNAISDFFGDEKKTVINTPPEATESNPEVYDDSDTNKLSRSEIHNLYESPAESSPIVDSDYWWCFEGAEDSEETPVFDEIDDEAVVEELHRRIDQGEFPIIEIPANVIKTMQILNNPEFDYNEIVHLIERSPAMTGEFIRVVNSSLYNRGSAISDLRVALPRLGRENIKAILYIYSSKLSFASDPLFNDLAADIIDHSYATALIASYMSQRFYPDPDGAFLAGLLHNIGKLGILKAISEIYELPKTLGVKLTEEVFGNIFPELYEKAGRYLAENWRVDETVVSAIEHHNDFQDFGFDEDSQLALHLCCIVNVSKNMAGMFGFGPKLEPTNIFSLPATIELAIEKDPGTIDFLEDIPKIVKFKVDSES